MRDIPSRERDTIMDVLVNALLAIITLIILGVIFNVIGVHITK